MLRVCPVSDWKALYDYQCRIPYPYHFPTPFENWKSAMLSDHDGEGRTLFQDLTTLIATDENRILGYVQFGHTAFGFGPEDISGDVHYSVIRMLYFAEDRPEAGQALLGSAMDSLGNDERVYAFFHYFGLSCYARHGKLHEGFVHIGGLLLTNGFQLEHENVYYAARDISHHASAVTLSWHAITRGGQQSCDFFLDGTQVGCCEVHYVQPAIAYLRWIFIFDTLQNQGVGSQCMTALMADLFQRGYTRLDTDTALDNCRAQHFYEKNAFAREGITRSYFKEPVSEEKF